MRPLYRYLPFTILLFMLTSCADDVDANDVHKNASTDELDSQATSDSEKQLSDVSGDDAIVDTESAAGTDTDAVDDTADTGEDQRNDTTKPMDSDSGDSVDTGTSVTGTAECTVASDCKVESNCCACGAYPANMLIASCSMFCDTPLCESQGIPTEYALCVNGNCVLDVNCDASTVKCRTVAPDCAQAMVPVVTENGSCWTGSCVSESECRN